MSELDTKRILERLKHLEKQNHNIKFFFSLVTLLSLIGLFSWTLLCGVQKVQAKKTEEIHNKEIIQSEGFVLVDSDGNQRARLVMEAGIPCLTFLSIDGKVAGRLAVGQRPEEKSTELVPQDGLYLYDTSGVARTLVRLSSGFSVYDEIGQKKSCMNSDGVRVFDGDKVVAMNDIGIGFYEGNWKRRVSLNSNNGLRLYNSDGKECASLQVNNGLRLYDSKGTSSVSLQPWIGLRLYGTGRSGLRLLGISSYDDAKRCRLSLDGNNGLIFYNAQGKPKMQPNPNQANNE